MTMAVIVALDGFAYRARRRDRFHRGFPGSPENPACKIAGHHCQFIDGTTL